MTERGLPSADMSPVCPFVAFEGERDERADRPDHRHRCYAESEPAPRALAHQEAYCLSSAFPVCPVFQEWARREAARARAAGEAPTPSPAPSLASSSAIPPVAPSGPPNGEADEWLAPPRASDDPDGGYDPHRNPRRDWAAPPPWATGGGPGAGTPRSTATTRAADADRRSDPPDFLEASPDESRGLAGSAADRLAMGASGAHDAPASGPDPELASLVAGSAAAHQAGNRVVDERLAAERAAERSLDDDEYGRSTADVPRSARSGRRPAVGSTRAKDRARDRERLPVHEHVQGVDGPSWERARRYEAYPTIRARAAVSGLPRVAVLAGALAIAALVLFFLPGLLGIFGGGDAAQPSPSPTPSPSVAVGSPTAQPSTGPAPEISTYVIKTGDTLSKVAADFGLTLEQLMEANAATITDPDLIAVGDEILIPIPPPDEVPGTVIGSPSPSP